MSILAETPPPLPADRVVEMLRTAIDSSDDADLRFYMRRVLNDPGHARLYVDRCAQLARLCHLKRGQRLLDVGCGFGWHAICTAALTGAEVVANDVRPLMTDAVGRELERLGGGVM